MNNKDFADWLRGLPLPRQAPPPPPPRQQNGNVQRIDHPLRNAPPTPLPVGQRLQYIEEKLNELTIRIQRIEEHLREQEQEQEAPRTFDNEQ